MTAFLSFIPRWVLAFAIVLLIGLSINLSLNLNSVQADLLTAKTDKADLELRIEKANTAAANQATELRNQVIEAQNEARKREQALRAAAVAAATESDGLRDDVAAMRVQLQQSNREAAIERATALGAVLQQCAARHQDLAQRCDRHVNDIQTLIDAWPKPKDLGHNTP